MLENFAVLQKVYWKSRINPMDKTISLIAETAMNAFNNRDYKTAADKFRKCLELLGNQDAPLDKAEIQNNLSVVLLELKDPQAAYSIAEGTDIVFAESGDKKRQAMALGNLASALQAQGKNAEALELFERSSDIFKEAGEKQLRAITLKKISDLQLKTGKHYQALASLDASYDQKDEKSVKEKVLKGVLGNVMRKLTRK
jgi:tetratricopeptide (TPR) repeat protein